MTNRVRRAVVNFRGVPYEMDLSVVRLALVRRQVEGEFHTVEVLADAVGRSRSTASRWFAGRQTSMPVVVAILDKLHLSFDDVYRRCGSSVPS